LRVGDAVVLTGGQKPGIRALAAVLFVAGLQHAIAGEMRAGGDGREYLAAAANCDVVLCSYVTKTVICHRLARACAYRPLPRSLHLERHRSHGSNPFHENSPEGFAGQNGQQALAGSNDFPRPWKAVSDAVIAAGGARVS
jgi:hypothetical protein